MKLPFRCLLCCIVSGARAGCEKDPDCPKISCKCNGCVAGNVSEDGNWRKQGGLHLSDKGLCSCRGRKVSWRLDNSECACFAQHSWTWDPSWYLASICRHGTVQWPLRVFAELLKAKLSALGNGCACDADELLWLLQSHLTVPGCCSSKMVFRVSSASYLRTAVFPSHAGIGCMWVVNGLFIGADFWRTLAYPDFAVIQVWAAGMCRPEGKGSSKWEQRCPWHKLNGKSVFSKNSHKANLHYGFSFACKSHPRHTQNHSIQAWQCNKNLKCSVQNYTWNKTSGSTTCCLLPLPTAHSASQVMPDLQHLPTIPSTKDRRFILPFI